jgi:GT2 family glycosyltransferase
MTESTIIIPTKNGREILSRCLPTVQRAITVTGGAHHILVVDDDSSDGTADWLAQEFPAVEVLSLRPSGFGRAVNAGVLHARSEAIVLLNNDVTLAEDFLAPLLAPLSDPTVFSVGAKFLTGEGTLDFVLGNRTHAIFRQGLIEVYHEMAAEKLTQRTHQLYAQGAAMSCSRQKYLELGGFDSLYEPFYWEDVDLSYRAAKRGWQVLYEPAAICRHYQSATTARDYRARYLQTISLRNAYLFMWKNITARRLFARHLAMIPARVANDILLGGPGVELDALRAAMRLLRPVAAKRVLERSFVVVSDAEVLRKANE